MLALSSYVEQTARRAIGFRVASSRKKKKPRQVVAMSNEFSSPLPPHPRVGDEICVAGTWIHSGAPNKVVTWIDQGGFDGYKTTPALPLDTAPGASATQRNVTQNNPPELVFGEVKRYGSRRLKRRVGASGDTTATGATGTTATPPRGPRGSLVTDAADLKRCVTQLVIHHDACGNSSLGFKAMHHDKGLSCHFLLDIDGRIFQTLDVMERAWHAGDADDVSIGVTLASLGAFREPEDLGTTPFDVEDGDNCVENVDFVRGVVNGQTYVQAPFSDKQTVALCKLYAALLHAFPLLRLGYPLEDEKMEAGFSFSDTVRSDSSDNTERYPSVCREKLTDDRRHSYRGVLGNFHVDATRNGPGPAFRWSELVAKTKESLLTTGAV